MPLRLPPLNSLRLFEAAGRHLSFKLAAEELHVTPSAVSHGIQTLEEWLGVALFARTSRGLVLTEAGLAYLPVVSEALVNLALGTEAVPGRRAAGRVLVSAAPTFATRWLLPRLADFHARHAGIEVVIDTTHRQLEFPVDGVDLAIRMGTGEWPGLAAVELFRDRLVPVAAPALLGRPPTIDDLRSLPLIHVSSITEDWQAWAAGAGVEGLELGRGMRVDMITMAFEAASQGLGIAIGRRPLVDSDLEAGRLVECLAPVVVAGRPHWLVGAEATMRRTDVATFRTWMLSHLTDETTRTAIPA